jgi:hypothetical protein
VRLLVAADQQQVSHGPSQAVTAPADPRPDAPKAERLATCGWWHGPRAEGLLGVLLEQEAAADADAEPEWWPVAVDETAPTSSGGGRGAVVGLDAAAVPAGAAQPLSGPMMGADTSTPLRVSVMLGASGR